MLARVKRRKWHAPASDQVSGCDASLESSGIMCCIDAEPADFQATTSSSEAVATLPSGPSCSAYGVEGVCLVRTSCPRGTTAHANRAGFVSGCGSLARNVQCCSAGRPPALPAGKTCVGYGRTGSCLTSSRCESPYRAYGYRRGYVEGCENEPPTFSAAPLALRPATRCRRFRA
jgi:hypothetical protein